MFVYASGRLLRWYWRRRPLSDKGVTLPAESDETLVWLRHRSRHRRDDVSFGRRDRELHNRDNPAIDREPEHRLCQALHVANDLLGRLGHSRKDMDLGDCSTFGDHTGSFDAGEPTDLLFEITKVHIRTIAAADGGEVSLKVLRCGVMVSTRPNGLVGHTLGL